MKEDRAARKVAILGAAIEELRAYTPMTVRQIFYRLVARQIVANTRSQYQAVGKALVDARKSGLIPWAWIEDRLRLPRAVSMWTGLADFAKTAREVYRRDVWETQPTYLEVWLEKDALSGVFLDVLEPYGVTLNVGRGYDGWSSIRNAAARYSARSHGDEVPVLYFGDFDPSGEDMVRSLAERLSYFGGEAAVEKIALTVEDIEEHDLPPDFTKRTDSRQAAFVARHGDVAVELDALPVTVLRKRLEAEVRARMDLEALERIKRTERREKARLVRLLAGKGE